ncbi:MAG: GGDEF domain-containing protein [Chloroflexota bacterium]
MTELRVADYFAIARTARFRVSQRRLMRDSARQGMLLATAVAVLGSIWFVPFHPAAGVLVVALNATVALVAMGGYVAIGSVGRRYPEVVVFLVLAAVDGATIALGFGHRGLAFVAGGYLLVLPIVVALFVPWRTSVHVAWLAMHAAGMAAFVGLADQGSLPGGRDELLGLFAVAVVVSQSGHVTNLRGRVLGFVQIERIRSLNRQSRRDRVQLDDLNTALEHSATTDSLTGLRNRSALDVDIATVRSRIQRQTESYGLLILDLDHFKSVNDRLGHLAGDDVLRTIGAALTRVLRPGDTAYRYGGEEFAVIVRLARPRDAVVVAERIRGAIEDLRIPNPGNPPYGNVTASIGFVVVGPRNRDSATDAWFGTADAALYRAKDLGRNRCEAARDMVMAEGRGSSDEPRPMQWARR